MCVLDSPLLSIKFGRSLSAERIQEKSAISWSISYIFSLFFTFTDKLSLDTHVTERMLRKLQESFLSKSIIDRSKLPKHFNKKIKWI